MENYEQKYKEALEQAKKELDACGSLNCDAARQIFRLFPELQSIKNERIKTNIIKLLRFVRDTHHQYSDECNEAIEWLEKQGEQLYIRFGEIPTDEKSKIYQGEIEVGTENGVSVYPAFKTNKGDIVLGLSLPITKTTLYTQQHLIEYDDRPCYLVKGDYVGKDADGQPLINNISIIEKIDSYRVKEGKQDKQNSTEEVDPKFEVGDIITNKKSKDTVKIVQILHDSYCYSGWDGAATVYSDFSISEQDNWELVEHTWSEEDEEMIDAVIGDIQFTQKAHNHEVNQVVYERKIDWLKSLKQRLNGTE